MRKHTAIDIEEYTLKILFKTHAEVSDRFKTAKTILVASKQWGCANCDTPIAKGEKFTIIDGELQHIFCPEKTIDNQLTTNV